MFLLEFRRIIKESYPGTPMRQASVEANPHAQGSQLETKFFLDQGLKRIQFPDKNKTNLVSIGRNVVSVHMLRPYRKWEEFKSRIEETLSKYCNTFPCDGIQQITIRYINRIELEFEAGAKLNLSQFFLARPITPPGISARITRFFDRTELIYDDEPIKLIVIFADTDSKFGGATFLLDLELIWEFGDDPIRVDQAMGKVEHLRNRERDIFESMITEKLREIFDAKSD